jgi:ubiquinone/menaquinone biosynthesis C-methylase UbiE
MSSKPNFDHIAKRYRLLEYLTMGRMLEQTRLHLLPRLFTARNALILGDGDGRFLAQLLAENPHLHATAVDCSSAMLDLLRQRCAPYGDRLHTVLADALSFTPPAGAGYDLVVSHFFFDCFTEPEIDDLLRRIGPELAPSALWLVSDFRIPPGSMRLPAKILVRGLYLAFRAITGLRITRLPDHTSCLSAARFRRLERNLFLRGVLTTELWRRAPLSPEAQAQKE